MTSPHHRRGLRAAVAATGLGLVAAPLSLLPSAAHAADPVTLTLLNINDFHGRINGGTVAFAGTVENLRSEAGEANTLFLSAGDNIGASVFASASADDKPTIDVLNALDLSASAVGNHEFDKGLEDLTGRVDAAAGFPYLGANVYKKGTTEPALDEYVVLDAAGLRVGVIGAVPVETPTLVSPDRIADLTFGDPVEAVNRVAAQLSDGNLTNGEADVIVAEYHEGAVEGQPEDATLEEQVAAGGAFADIATNTSDEVDAIFTGHTHKQYTWHDGTRPIVQTGSYGETIGKVTLTVDPADDSVTSYAAELVERLEPTDTNADHEISDEEQAAFEAELVAASERTAQVEQIVDDALAAAAEKGSVPVGSVVDDITTAFLGGTYGEDGYTGGERDDRMSESTLGNLVANALRDTLDEERLGGAEIGVVNPGGLRSELFYAGEEGADTNGDGVITYAEANAVLPFVNNLWTVTLTGRQFTQLLEQQWQPADSSRPFLHLGLSDNVSVTLDAGAAAGKRVTSVRVDGRKLRPREEYRIGTFSFLAQGGDNFTVFEEGTDVKDSGLIDRDAWIAYLRDNAGLAPSTTVVRSTPPVSRR